MTRKKNEIKKKKCNGRCRVQSHVKLVGSDFYYSFISAIFRAIPMFSFIQSQQRGARYDFIIMLL